MFFKKFRAWRLERWWEKHGRKDAFTWTHRYLRLHGELLDDPIYKDMFDFHRATLVAYLKRDEKHQNMDEEQLGELVDVLADIFNRFSAERVNAYKPMVDALYNAWKNMPDIIKGIRV